MKLAKNNSQLAKITSVYCNCSKLFLTHINCTLVDVSRTFSYMNLILILKKPVSNLRVDVNIFFRRSSGAEFKRIISWPKIDVCKFAEDIETYSILKSYLMYTNKTFNGIIHSCPYKRVEFSNVNFSLNSNDKLETFLFPSGENKFSVRIYNNRVKNLAFYEIVLLQRLVKNKEWIDIWKIYYVLNWLIKISGVKVLIWFLGCLHITWT